MAYSFEQVFAADPSNPANVARNAAVTIFAPGDIAKTPLTLTTPNGDPLANPLQVNNNGFGSAFMHATLDRVAWSGGNFTGFFTSYEGMKAEAVSARTAAQEAAATAQASALAPTDEQVDAGIVRADIATRVTDAIAADGTVVAAAEAAVSDAVVGLDLLERADQDVAGVLIALSDSAGNRTFLEANDVDGGPTAYSADLIAAALGDVSAFLPSDTYVHNSGDIVPIAHDMTKVALWGSSTLDSGSGVFNTTFQTLGVTTYNGAKMGEMASHIGARLGSRPALLTVTGGSIPASGGVTVTTPTMIASSFMRPYSGWLNGIHGTLSATDTVITFTRTAAGTATAVPADAPFKPELGPLHRSDVAVINMGKNDLNVGVSSAAVIEMTDAAHDWIGPLAKRVLVLGHFVNTGISAGNSQRAEIAAISAAHLARYGARFVDITAYITSAQVWIDTGITPTQADLDEQAIGNKPPSLTPVGDPAHFNTAGYQAIFNLAKARAIALGWY